MGEKAELDVTDTVNRRFIMLYWEIALILFYVFIV